MGVICQHNSRRKVRLEMTIIISLVLAIAAASTLRAWCIWRLAREAMKED